MSPSKEEIEEAIEDCETWTASPHAKPAGVLVAALRASEARNALLERQYTDLQDWVQEPYFKPEEWPQLMARHAREREALK
jgi:hypothetical protein